MTSKFLRLTIVCAKCDSESECAGEFENKLDLTGEHDAPKWCEFCGELIPVELTPSAQWDVANVIERYVFHFLDNKLTTADRDSDAAKLWRAYDWLRLNVTVGHD